MVMSRSVTYDESYFKDGIFDTNYSDFAEAILSTYTPKRVLDLGCGPGHLAKALAARGVSVVAMDGFSHPQFDGLSIEFRRLDLNDTQALAQLLEHEHFDLALCVEVAEHLNPEVSEPLVAALTRVAPVVIFSAAVPGQGGHGHINLRPREEWHAWFTQRGFVLRDSLRSRLRANEAIAPWYRFNVLDYVRQNDSTDPIVSQTVARLVASESAAASAFFEMAEEARRLSNLLKYRPIRWYLAVRNFAKRLAGRA